VVNIMKHKRLPIVLAILVAAVALGALVLAALPATGDDDPPVCFTYDSTTTCQAAAAVADHGIYIAVVTCDPDSATIHGILPDGATRLTTVGADAPTSAYGDVDGAVSLTVAGGALTGLSLDNGNTAPLALEPDCDKPSPPSP
jgi:hypothetical protein